ncbi:DUF5808 domain-containing protein [Mucilaginibacter sp. BT774]|uniref:DUF5808 domain-containing protein n=1 Tax=Mucilaginibacter sp. BT774 TaxID=3062276 RepID=UPI0034A0052F
MEPTEDPLNYKFGVFYVNRNDIRTVVPKRTKAFGWTLNFAKWKSYAFVALIIGSVVLSILLSK